MQALLERLETLIEAKRDTLVLADKILSKGAKHPLFKGIEREIAPAIAAARKDAAGASDWGQLAGHGAVVGVLLPALEKLGERGERAARAIRALQGKHDRPLFKQSRIGHAIRRGDKVR